MVNTLEESLDPDLTRVEDPKLQEWYYNIDTNLCKGLDNPYQFVLHVKKILDRIADDSIELRKNQNKVGINIQGNYSQYFLNEAEKLCDKAREDYEDTEEYKGCYDKYRNLTILRSSVFGAFIGFSCYEQNRFLGFAIGTLVGTVSGLLGLRSYDKSKERKHIKANRTKYPLAERYEDYDELVAKMEIRT
jgi:hypothetical protein